MCDLLIQFDFKVISNLITIAIGWWIVHTLSSKRDLEKLKKENSIKVIDEAVKMLEEISQIGINYHLKDRSQSDEFEIKNKIQNFSKFMYAVEKFIGSKNNISNCVSQIKKLRQAITSKHFEDEHTEKVSNSDVVLKEIVDVHLVFRQSLIDVKFSILSTK